MGMGWVAASIYVILYNTIMLLLFTQTHFYARSAEVPAERGM